MINPAIPCLPALRLLVPSDDVVYSNLRCTIRLTSPPTRLCFPGVSTLDPIDSHLALDSPFIELRDRRPRSRRRREPSAPSTGVRGACARRLTFPIFVPKPKPRRGRGRSDSEAPTGRRDVHTAPRLAVAKWEYGRGRSCKERCG